MAEAWEIVVAGEFEGERIDRFLRRSGRAGSRSAVSEQLARGSIRVNGARIKKGQRLRAGDRVSGPAAPDGPRTAARPDPALALAVLYEDAEVVVVDKPAGIPSHPLRADETGTVASALLARYPEMANVGHRALEPGILHRLDTDTSGALLAARDPSAFRALALAHRRGELDKRYLALCSGRLQAPQRLHAYLRADQRRVRVEAEPFERAHAIETELIRATHHGAFTLVEVRVPFAARHQVRAQLAALGHPIVSDALYGGLALPGLGRHFLHASAIEFPHPSRTEKVRVEAPLPAELVTVLDALA